MSFNRPQTRGGMNAPSQSGRRTPAGSSNRMGTRMGTAQRTAANGQPLQSVGLSTNVVVDNRPVTRQGLTGMHTKPLGPGRQIADDKYYISELRNNITDITKETANMKQEIQDIITGNQRYATLSADYEQKVAAVKALEGELADFNLATDKLRSNANAKDVKAQAAQLGNKNDSGQEKVNETFIATQATIKKIKEMERKINDIHNQVENRINEALGPESAEEYKSTQALQVQLNEDLRKKQSETGLLNSKIDELRKLLNEPQYQVHQQGLELQKQKQKLLRQREELETDTDANLTPEELKERIVAKVKAANTECEDLERSSKEMQANVEKLYDTIRAKEQQLADAKKHAMKAKKYEAVYDRDRKMQEFLDEFPKVYQEEKNNMSKLKSTITALLKHISQQMSTAENLPDASALADMKNELSFKEQTLKNSKNTLTLLESDLSLRKEELQKIESLDKKINAELKSLKDKIKSMQVEQDQFKSEDELKKEATEAKKKLLQEKQRTKKLRDASKHNVQVLAQAYNKRKQELANNETMKRIDALEQRLRTYTSTVFSLQDFINSRKRESDYDSIRSQVNEICFQINKHVISQINS